MIRKLTTRYSFWLIILALLAAPTVGSQTSEKKTGWTGKYEGTAKGPEGDVKITLDLMEDAGKFSGNITTPRIVYAVTKGSLVDGTLSLDLDGKGSTAKLSLKQKDDKLAGELTASGKAGAVELKRVTTDEISGVWEAVADAGGQPVPFVLTLKLDGEKVTGGSSSQLGDAQISNGSWKDGKLSLVLEGGSGQIALGASLNEGKLVGEFDYAGQSQGKWAAVKKKP